MKCVSLIISWGLLIWWKNSLFGSKTSRVEHGIAIRRAGKVTRNILSMVFLKSSTLGRFTCLRFSLSRRVCVLFLLAKTSAKMPRFDSFLHVYSWFEMAKSSRPKATVRRSCCASTMFLYGSGQECSAEDPGSEGPECSQADPRGCRAVLLMGNWCPRETT